MILQALTQYYERKAADPDSGIAPPGFEYKEIPFIIVIDHNGHLVNIEDAREVGENRRRARSFLVPHSEKRAVNVKAQLLWDTLEYVLGIPSTNKPERVALQHRAFIDRIDLLALDDDTGIHAVKQFLSASPSLALEGIEGADDIQRTNPFITFRLVTDTELVCQRKSVIERTTQLAGEEEEPQGICLVSGIRAPVTRLHPAVKGVRGTSTRGGDIVSFNLDAFRSFGKKRGANAPVSKFVSFAYTTALNHLLRKDSNQKLQVGDATTVFWSERPSHLEDDFGVLLDEPPKDDPDAQAEKVRALLRSADTGAFPREDLDNRFYVAGLSPNAARISVRFWYTGTVAEFSHRIAQHFRDLEITHATFQRDHLSIRSLLRSIAPLGRSDSIPPNLAGDWMRAILDGAPYPESLFQSALRRIHAERKITYERAAIIKGYINRKARFQINPKEEITMTLDVENTNPGYRAGRLFAVLERIQEAAQHDINAGIRDRYYSSASGTPAAVFPILLRLKNHHLRKLEKGREIYFERLLQEVMGAIEANGFPSHLNLPDQGRFAIGYYHQRQAFYSSSQPFEPNPAEQGD